MAKQAKYKDSPFDTLGSRITQLKGVMNAVQNTWDDEHEYMMPDSYMHDAPWAVVELIDQAQAAFDSIVSESVAEWKKKQGEAVQ